MQIIDLDKRYKKKVLTGEKKATIRMGKRNIRLGEPARLKSGRTLLGLGTITGVQVKKIKHLNRKDAELDGFSSLEELLAALEKHYKTIDPGKKVTVIHFELEEKSGKEFEYSKKQVLEICQQASEKLALKESEKLLVREILRWGDLRRAAKELGDPEIVVELKSLVKELSAMLDYPE